MVRIVRSVVRVAGAAAIAWLWGPVRGEAQIQIDLSGDQVVVEGNSGTISLPFSATLTGTWAAPITVSYRTLAGSASGPADFVVIATGMVTFNPGDLNKPLGTPAIQVQNDTTPEWNTTLQHDEVFFVELFNPTNATIRRGRASVTVVDNDAVQPGVQYLTVVSDSTGSGLNDARNRLQWRVAPAPTAPTMIKVAWKSDPSSCTPPLSDTAGEAPGPITLAPATPGSKQMWTHDAAATTVPRIELSRVYCYTVFTYYPGPSSDRAEVIVRTFDSTSGRVAWTFTPGHYNGSAAPDVLPPTIGADGIYTVGTDGIVHAMQRGVGGGIWPLLWNPVGLGKPAHNRSPVVPLPNVGSRLFVGTEDGEVHALDGRTGNIAWSRSALFGGSQLMPASVGMQAAPAGIFKDWGGQNDLLLVGTANGANNTEFFALDPFTGAMIDKYPLGGDTPPGPMRNVFGMAVVDYAANRVYFGTADSAFTVWALDLGPTGAPNLTLSAPAWNPKPVGGGGTTGSLVLRGDRLYFGTDTGPSAAVHSLCVTDGVLYSYTHGDGQVKGFTWPDRRDGRLYFSTANKVHAVRDNVGSLTPFWGPLTFNGPSMLLQRPGTDDLYVGDADGRLVQINASTSAQLPVILDADGGAIGAPSLDNVHGLVHVGSSKGVIYAVRVPF